jgi:hypothetical protein
VRQENRTESKDNSVIDDSIFLVIAILTPPHYSTNHIILILREPKQCAPVVIALLCTLNPPEERHTHHATMVDPTPSSLLPLKTSLAPPPHPKQL